MYQARKRKLYYNRLKLIDYNKVINIVLYNTIRNQRKLRSYTFSI